MQTRPIASEQPQAGWVDTRDEQNRAVKLRLRAAYRNVGKRPQGGEARGLRLEMVDDPEYRRSQKRVADRMFSTVPVIAILVMALALCSAVLGYGH
jgi:hypothetical protein